MPGLILDSSTDTLILALSTAPPCCQTFDEAARLGSTLFPLLASFLQEHQETPEGLSYIAVGRGPGSYTGTRAAVAAAQGFSLATGIPLIYFPSLLAFLPPSDSGKIAALLEIKGSEDVHSLFYEKGFLYEKKISLLRIAQELSTLEAVACAKDLLPLLQHHPLSFSPEIALPRIATWIEERSQQSTEEQNLVYLQTQL